MDIQIIVIFVVVVLAIIFVALAMQAYYILCEFRKTVSKANKVLDDVGIIAESISGPISSIASISNGLKIGGIITRLFKSVNKNNNDDEENEDGE
ncbi:hypothetical protein LBMAG33_6440 [Candidatus Levyibacteriota bacterium]|nr:hypothetical protein [Candidatus Levybacteria bacterium]MSU25754.1 hypothetical protein [Candidatus Levybacteria bacterium]GDX62334.1 hypothetical protein LBMAG33_6440 [Candidatus Levybacteria bacterium]